MNELVQEKCNTSISILDLLTRSSIVSTLSTTLSIIDIDDKIGATNILCINTVLLLRDVAFMLILLETAYKKPISKCTSILNHRNQREKQNEAIIDMSSLDAAKNSSISFHLSNIKRNEAIIDMSSLDAAKNSSISFHLSNIKRNLIDKWRSETPE
uniref:Uncharacterized protein n=1 Tax=Wuchereria bancrofti TaxID=6293 RepID=A0AAF5Q6R0_WUCBA